eukprot:CAMPEP_0172655852 /NCGR_PEP_ID=MMETSP1074-20121228/962_1 /TAXON_ID=2916 /ORGANISM="Ceratium fusus, Strain PA161109" /LENGTH=210 /DNA_ID=CAMNT_0013470589 /DNA_START=52 /DNA_END=681 /DNA_ORIENTATION=+
MARRTLLPTCLVVVAVALAASCWSAVTFIPCNRRQAATGLAASALATLLNQEAASAKKAGTKFSFFGFGDGYSDPYSQRDPDQPDPYTEFSNQKDRIKFEDNPEIVERKKTNLRESYSRLEKVPELIRTKNSEDLKSLLTLQLYTLRGNMEYITAGGSPFFRNNDEKTPQFELANGFFQDLNDLGVWGREKKWDQASESYANAMEKLVKW